MVWVCVFYFFDNLSFDVISFELTIDYFFFPPEPSKPVHFSLTFHSHSLTALSFAASDTWSFSQLLN